MASRQMEKHCTCCRSGTRSTTDCVRTGPVSILFTFTANVTCLVPRQAAVAAPVAQTSEPRAGFRMGQSSYRTDVVAGSSAADDELAPAVLLPAHHASEADCQALQCARGPSAGGTNHLSLPPVTVASPGTLGTAPEDPPGPRRGPRRSAMCRSRPGAIGMD